MSLADTNKPPFCTGLAVSLDTLTPQQLSAVKKQLDEEVEHLSTSYAQLAAAQNKFKECLRVVTAGETYFDGAFNFRRSFHLYYTKQPNISFKINREKTNHGTPDQLSLRQRSPLRPQPRDSRRWYRFLRREGMLYKPPTAPLKHKCYPFFDTVH